MINQRRIGKDLKGNLLGLTDVLSLYLPELTEEDHESFIQDYIPAEIGTEYLTTVSRED
jgi:hypothetical protein